MNQTIDQIIWQAGKFAYDICKEEGREGGIGDNVWHGLFVGKYTELLLEECLGVISSDQSLHSGATYANKIKTHFGLDQ